jgi:hypothetical protein
VHVFSLILGEPIMKTRFVAENRGFLRLSCGVARFYGLLLLFVAGMTAVGLAVSAISGLSAPDVAKQSFWLTGLSRLLTLILAGLLALALAEFIRYVTEGEGEPKWILRHADKTMFAYAVFIAVASVSLAGKSMPGGPRSDFSNLIPLVFMAIHAVGTPLIFIGIGITLRKILPIIQESKTLV